MNIYPKIQEKKIILCRLRLRNSISSELFSDKQIKNETNVKRLLSRIKL